MKEFVFNSALGLLSSPFASSKKESATAAAIGIGAGVGTLAANVYSSYKNLQSQADTNAANKEINREQLAAQRYLYDQQRADERFLVNQAYERNLPKNQVKNLREAGINPAFAMENGSFGVQQAQVGSAPSAPSVGSPIPMQRSDYSGFGVAASQAANLIAQAMQTDKENVRANTALSSDISAKNRELDLKEMDLLSQIKSRGISDDKVKQEMNSIIEDIEFRRSTSSERERAIRVANDKIRSDQLYTEELTKAQQFANEIAPGMHENQKKIFAAELCKAAAEVAEIESRKDLNQEQKNLVTKQITEQVLRNKDLPKSLHNDNSIKVATYREIKNRASYVRQQTETEYWNSKDARKTYRSHTGSNRPLSEYVEDAIKNRGKVKKGPMNVSF